MLIRCPSCSGGFEMSDESLGVKATVVCPLCGRIVVARDAKLVPPGKKEATVPFDPRTEAAVEPVNAAEEATDVAAVRKRLGLPAGKRVSLAILAGPRKGDLVVLSRPRVVIGREGAGADIQVPDPEMSRAHAALECRGARVVLMDLGSRNGTFVGDERVQTRDLENQAEFRLAGTSFMLILSDR